MRDSQVMEMITGSGVSGDVRRALIHLMSSSRSNAAEVAALQEQLSAALDELARSKKLTSSLGTTVNTQIDELSNMDRIVTHLENDLASAQSRSKTKEAALLESIETVGEISAAYERLVAQVARITTGVKKAQIIKQVKNLKKFISNQTRVLAQSAAKK